MNVRISTTNDPRSDWYGVDAKGVVDVEVVGGRVWWAKPRDVTSI
jgi:hypothetical protein